MVDGWPTIGDPACHCSLCREARAERRNGPDLCACGHTWAQHEVRNGYCPLRLDEFFRPAPDLPVMALRPEVDGAEVTCGTLMDDIVVEDVTTFRAEAMDTDSFWVCCYLKNGERITWHVNAHARPKRLTWEIGELPDYIDWDEHPEARK
jgi:hypothetical protein